VFDIFFFQEQYEEKVKLFGKMQYLSIDEYREIYNKTQIDVDGRLELYCLGRTEMTKMFNEYVKFSQGVIGFTSLPSKDQAALLRGKNKKLRWKSRIRMQFVLRWTRMKCLANGFNLYIPIFDKLCKHNFFVQKLQ
jgi:hypothetical protein